MAMTVQRPSDLLGMDGLELGSSAWFEVTQGDINLFADATHDHQWIHTDVARAADGPFGGTVAHGYLTLSLVIPMWSELLVVEEFGMAVNYGLNRVRFPAPVPSGSRIRLGGRLSAIREVPGGVEVVADLAVEIEASEKPACVLEAVYRFYD